jgi:hypothetical protein
LLLRARRDRQNSSNATNSQYHLAKNLCHVVRRGSCWGQVFRGPLTGISAPLWSTQRLPGTLRSIAAPPHPVNIQGAPAMSQGIARTDRSGHPANTCTFSEHLLTVGMHLCPARMAPAYAR